jgi:hypothetical protein
LVRMRSHKGVVATHSNQKVIKGYINQTYHLYIITSNIFSVHQIQKSYFMGVIVAK